MIRKLLNKNRYYQCIILITSSVINTFIDVFSLSLIFPFLLFISGNGEIFLDKYGKYIPKTIAVELDNLKVTLIFCTFSLIAAYAKIKFQNYQIKLSYTIGGDIAQKMYSNIIRNTYEEIKRKNSIDIINAIASKATLITYNVILPIVQIISSVFTLICIIFMLYIAGMLKILYVFGIIGLVYFVIIYLNRKERMVIGREIDTKQNKTLRQIQDSISELREIILEKRIKEAEKEFECVDVDMRNAQARLQILSSWPKSAIEGIGMVVMALAGYYAIDTFDENSKKQVIPLLGTLALTAQRALPLFQTIYSGLVQITGTMAVVRSALPYLENIEQKTIENSEIIRFENEIKIENLKFNYKASTKKIINKSDEIIKIKKGEIVAIIGGSGVGKSTFIDILMGLLKPSEGAIYCDEVKINENNISDWTNKISLVPQDFYLKDTTIYENITGKKGLYTQNDLKYVSSIRFACADEFINNLDEKSNSIVGERGGLLSGGQRQRIAIARAIYRDKEIIVLDEATSALDLETEKNILNNLKTLNNKTIIMITHRRENIHMCSNVIELNKN